MSIQTSNGNFQHVNGVDEVLQSLEKSTIQFFKTGSRFFGNPRKDSDWDFYTLCTEEAILELENLGFVNNGVGSYTQDSLVVFVYRHKTYPVDIQLVNNLENKHKAQNLLYDNGILAVAPKDLHVKIWNLVCSVVFSQDDKCDKCTSYDDVKTNSNDENHLIHIGIKCNKCRDIIYSRAIHDFRFCSCGAVAVDGGFEYLKITGENFQQVSVNLGNVTEEMLYDDWNRVINQFGLIKDNG